MFQAFLNLFKPKVEDLPIIYETSQPVLFSFLADGAFEKYYLPWRFRNFRLCNNGIMLIMKANNKKTKHILNLSTCYISTIDITDSGVDLLQGNIGFKVECNREDANGLLTHFRCLMKRSDAIDFCIYAKRVSQRNNIDTFLDSLNPTKEEYQSMHIEPESHIPESTMRFTLGKVLDRYERIGTKQGILNRRVVFKWLPVKFKNDLIHGSWWFVFGSLFITAVAVFVLLATYYDTILGDDDSILSKQEFRVAWILLVMSGVFFTLGSLAFVRAMNDPPMKPLFRCYHISTDELLGSWLFLLGVFPAIPYSILFLKITHSIAYLGMLLISILCFIGTYYFVKACYPSDSSSGTLSSSNLLPYFECICGKRTFLKRHLSTDWLAGTWIIFWSSLGATILCLLYSLYALSLGESTIASFVNITGFFDCVWFLIGSAYFVAGSYPVMTRDAFESIETPMFNELSLRLQ